MRSHYADVNGLRLHYLEEGSGLPVLFLHGWPTNAQLWRKILPSVGKHRRAIALDLPGFGASDKPIDRRYDFKFYEDTLEGFREHLGVEKLGLAVHDLGGPVGLYWATRHAERVTDLAVLNTLVYPEFSLTLKLFMLALRTPGVRRFLTSPRGIAGAMRIGVQNKRCVNREVAALYQKPYESDDARKALLLSALGASVGGFHQIKNGLAEIKAPVRVVYGRKDRILPDVAETMRRLESSLPQAEFTALADTGHFLQEDAPEEVAELLAEFFSRHAA
ncbi:MAG: alpha/beta fold hydrolase [Pseudomonadota bacterium]